jgi:hypothetical protein
LTTELLANVINRAGNRGSAPAKAGNLARIRRLIQAGAQVDALLAMIELQLPEWRLRRLALDDGLWHCSLSRQPNLPIELDDTVEGQHEHVALAILAAFSEALEMAAASCESIVRVMPTGPTAGYAICCDNFS